MANQTKADREVLREAIPPGRDYQICTTDAARFGPASYRGRPRFTLDYRYAGRQSG